MPPQPSRPSVGAAKGVQTSLSLLASCTQQSFSPLGQAERATTCTSISKRYFFRPERATPLFRRPNMAL